MPYGTSGRIVIEIDPELKAQLYQTLGREGISLKAWFLRRAEEYLYDGEQLSLRLREPAGAVRKNGS